MLRPEDGEQKKSFLMPWSPHFKGTKYLPNVNRYIAYRTVGIHEPQLRPGRNHRRSLDIGNITTVDPGVMRFFRARQSTLSLIDQVQSCSGNRPRQGVRGRGRHFNVRHTLQCPNQSSRPSLSRHDTRFVPQGGRNVEVRELELSRERRKVQRRWLLSSKGER